MIAFIIGNGESRKNIDLYRLKKLGILYGCNAIYRDFPEIDVLVAKDKNMIQEICLSGWQGDFRTDKHFGVSGVTAAHHAILDGHNMLVLIGMDFKNHSRCQNNIYKDTKNYEKIQGIEVSINQWHKLAATFRDVQFFRVGYNLNIPNRLCNLSNFLFIHYDNFKKDFGYVENDEGQ